MDHALFRHAAAVAAGLASDVRPALLVTSVRLARAAVREMAIVVVRARAVKVSVVARCFITEAVQMMC